MVQVVALFLPASLGASISVAGIALTTATGALTVAGIAVNIAGGLVFNAGLSKVFAPDPPALSPASLMVNVAQDTAPRVKHWGTVKVGYSIPLAHVKNGVLARIIVHGHGEFSNFLGYYLDKEAIVLDANGFVTNEKYQHSSGNLFGIIEGSGRTAKVRILNRPGTVPSAYYPELTQQIPEWSEDHRLDGLAQSLLFCSLPPQAAINAMYPNREPVLEVVAETSPVLDPRTGLKAFSDNLALCALDYELSPDGADLDGWVNLDAFRIAADNSDLMMPLAEGGEEPKYRFAGSADLNEEPAKVRKRFADASAGEYYIGPDGKLGFRVGGWEEPRFTLTEDMLLDYNQDFEPDPVESYNVSAFEYVDPDLNFATTPGDPWVDAARVAREGENKSSPFISSPSHRQCRHVVKERMGLDNPSNSLRVGCKPKALVGLYERVMAVDLPSYGISGVYRVKFRDLQPDLSRIMFELAVITNENSELTLEEQGEKPVYEPLSGSDVLPTPEGFNVAPVSVGGVAGIGAAWFALGVQGPLGFPSGSDRTDLTPLLEYSLAGEDDWLELPVTTGGFRASIALVDGQAYDWRMAWKTAGERVGPYAVKNGVVADTATAIPAAPTAFSVVAGSSSATISVTSSADVSNWKTEILRGGEVVGEIVGDPSVAEEFEDPSGEGFHTWEARAVGITGEYSTTNAGPVSDSVG